MHHSEYYSEKQPGDNVQTYEERVETRSIQSSDRRVELSETQLLDVYCQLNYGYQNEYSAQWMRSDGSVAGNGEHLFLRSVMKKDEGEYTCRIQDLRNKNIISINKILLTVRGNKTRIKNSF